MSNVDRIVEVAEAHGVEYDGNNLKTFGSWKKSGRAVQKGEKALLKVQLWIPKKKSKKEKEDEEQDDNQKMVLKWSHLFSIDQTKEMKKK